MNRPIPACGNPKCGVSTGICDSTTFGSGRLSSHGYWEFPCAVCARAWEAKYPGEGECWPFADQDIETLKGLMKQNLDAELEEEIEE